MMRPRWIIFGLLLLAACSGSAGTAAPVVPTASLIGETTAAAPVTPALLPTLTPAPAQTSETSSSAAPATAAPAAASVTSFPDTAQYAWQRVAAGLANPLGLAHAGDGSGRLFVVEQAGRIWIFQEGRLSDRPFLDIRGRVGSAGFEQGLLGLAFHPQYAQNGYFFVNYTDLTGDTVIARFQVTPDDANRADSGSEAQLLAVNQPYQNHNGGVLAFGPDGYLYIGLGDGGSAGDPRGFGQSLATHLGKILRINPVVSTSASGGALYTIPAENPFVGDGGLVEIWAYGLRNPWRFAFDRLTGDLYIADVGQNQWEEINFVAAGTPGGLNFGWKYYEGSHAYEGSASQGTAFVFPVAEYSHAEGCSVTGGVVYRGPSLSEWQGIYLYGDYCTGRVWGLLRDAQGNWQNRVLFEGMGRITSFGEDEAGEVYLVDQAGNVFVLERK